MARRVFYTIVALLLAIAAFYGADPSPSINCSWCFSLFCAVVVWFFWDEILAGYAYLDDSGVPRYEPTGMMFIRFAPMHIREFTGKKRRRS